MGRICKTSADVRAALAKRFCAPEWAIMWEVSNGTGALGGQRYADAVAMSVWPSRGLELWGMEIKVSRADWKRESADPTKAELIAAYCDRWIVVTTPGVVSDVSELPPAWGWFEATDARIVQRKQAEKTDAKTCDRQFLAALLRRAGALDEARVQAEIEQRDRDRSDKWNKEVDRRVADRMSRQGDLAAIVEQFKAASGIDLASYNWGIGEYMSPKELGKAVCAIHAALNPGGYGGLSEAAKRLRAAADELDTAQALLAPRVIAKMEAL